MQSPSKIHGNGNLHVGESNRVKSTSRVVSTITKSLVVGDKLRYPNDKFFNSGHYIIKVLNMFERTSPQISDYF